MVVIVFILFIFEIYALIAQDFTLYTLQQYIAGSELLLMELYF